MARPLLAHLDDIADVARLYDDPTRRLGPEPWVGMNMITTFDGGIQHEGLSGTLALSGDRFVFPTIRDHADVVLVGAGTVRAERYRHQPVDDEAMARRHAAGCTGPLRFAVVTASLRFDDNVPLFAEPAPEGAEPIVVTTRAALDTYRGSALDRAEVVVAGDTNVDLALAVAAIGDMGAQVVLAEGGPTLNGALHDHDLLDELCLTLSPHLLGDDTQSIVVGANTIALHRFRPVHALMSSEGELIMRYLRDSSLDPVADSDNS